MDEPTDRLRGGYGPASRVLVVDDCPDTARMMKLLLKREGYEVRTALDGPDALEAARSQPPDAVLLDMTLTTMGGLEVASELRSTPGLEAILIVAVSGRGPEAIPKSSPFDHHLTKPVDHDRLLALLSANIKPAGRPQSGPGGA